MRVEYIDQFSTWVLKLETINGLKTIQYSSSIPTGNVNKLNLYSDDKEPLIAIGKALYFAIKNCRGLDRFKIR